MLINILVLSIIWLSTINRDFIEAIEDAMKLKEEVEGKMTQANSKNKLGNSCSPKKKAHLTQIESSTPIKDNQGEAIVQTSRQIQIYHKILPNQSGHLIVPSAYAEGVSIESGVSMTSVPSPCPAQIDEQQRPLCWIRRILFYHRRQSSSELQ